MDKSFPFQKFHKETLKSNNIQLNYTVNIAQLLFLSDNTLFRLSDWQNHWSAIQLNSI